MSWTLLPTNYTDAVWSGLKKYSQISNSDGTVSFQDMTSYTNRENSFFGANDANRMNEALNYIMSMLENGTDLYESFLTYFQTQQTLFTGKADEEYASFVAYLTDLETEGFTSLTFIKNEAVQASDAARGSELAAKTSETNAKASENAAKTSETNAQAAESGAIIAKTAAETAKSAAETAQTQAAASATAAEAAATRASNVSVKVPYVGDNGNWYVWDNDTGGYVDTGTHAQGAQGPKGEQGVQGVQGPQGINGVALAADGIFAFNVNAEGHLIVEYTGTDAPDFSINAEGHLIVNL